MANTLEYYVNGALTTVTAEKGRVELQIETVHGLEDILASADMTLPQAQEFLVRTIKYISEQYPEHLIAAEIARKITKD